ncbi:MAG: M13 family metallopeptidase [Pseudomonadota bacterium]
MHLQDFTKLKLRIIAIVASLALGPCLFAQSETPTEKADAGFGSVSVWAGVHPGDDFYGFANGDWQAGAVIADDARSAGTLRAVTNRTEAQVDDVVKRLVRRRWEAGSDEAKFKTVYRSHLDLQGRRGARNRPIRPLLQAIDGIRLPEDIAALLGSYQLDAGGFVAAGLKIDGVEGRGYVAAIEPASLLLGRREVYLRNDIHAANVRIEAAAILEDLLKASLTRRRNNLAKRVERVLALEARLAEIYPGPVEARDRRLSNTILTVDELVHSVPDFPWAVYLGARGFGALERVHVAISSDRLEALGAVFAETPRAVWQDYLRLRLIVKYGRYLSGRTELLVSRFDTALRGLEFERPTLKERAQDVARLVVPDVVGRAYLDAHLDPDAVDMARFMAEMIREAYRQRIGAVPWMGEETRQKALTKLDALEVVIGGPAGWNSYEGFDPIEGSIFANVYSKVQLSHVSAFTRLASGTAGSRPDIETLRGDIFFSPLTVGAFYLPNLNTIIIPAAYLQPPYLDLSADLATNFGALGTSLGHEFAHAFDDQGSKRGPTGQLENWWTDIDREAFDDIGERLSTQLAGYEAAPGIPLNTELTLGENLSDLAGIELAILAYELALVERPELAPPDLQEGKRRLFLGYAVKRRSKRRPDLDIDFALNDPHSPPEVRVNGILRNVDAWYEAFGVTQANRLWLQPQDRIRIWSF